MNNIWKWIKRLVSGFSVMIIAFTTLIYAAGVIAKSRLARENPPPGKLIAMGEFYMHLYCIGEGSPAVILEAGLNDFYVAWSKVQPEIAKVTRVCSYDRAGLGWSEANPNPRKSEVMAEELHTLLTNAGVEGPYILVGHSFGGIVMRVFARQYPSETAGIVLVDSAHEDQGARLPFIQSTVDKTINQFRSLSLLSRFGLIALSPASIPNRGFSGDAYKQYQAILATTNYFDCAIAETTAFYADAPSVKAAGLGDLPLIVLSHGLPDKTSGIDQTQQIQFEQEWSKMQKELVDLSSQGKQIIAEQSSHYIQLDQPELVIEAILELVKPGR